ncbi:phosphate ABC transporter substrate-binding protein PstS [Agromyces seonyuensis]|uniref:phosphate ABC transporter substrate-binding protein PstS n=1 Tax=Agromyces seonyuensis TaxID=2662446 RepID=UPI003014BFBE
MNALRPIPAAALAVAVALLLSSCAANERAAREAATDSDLSGNLVGTGSSAQDAAQQAWIAAFQTAHPDVTIDYDPNGSGAGRETFIEGAADYGASDRAYTLDELADGAFAACVPDSDIVELPLYIAPIAVIFNLDGIDSLDLSPDVLAEIFAGTITRWDDPAIAATNPDVALPAIAITPVHRSDDSGTTETFTEYLGAVAPDAWTWQADGVWPIKGGEAAQGNSGVVDSVGRGSGAIGYADASRAGGLGTVRLGVGDEFVAFSPEAAAAVADHSPFEPGRSDVDLAIAVDRSTTESGVYPLVLVSYLIACADYLDAEDGALVREYLAYVASPEGQEAGAAAAGSAPISDSLRERVEAAIAVIG